MEREIVIQRDHGLAEDDLKHGLRGKITRASANDRKGDSLMTFRRVFVMALTLIVGSLLFQPSINGQESYEGQRLSIVVSYFPGGGYDIYSRLFARHLPRYIPGRPSIIVQNMPGAGSIIGANYLYRVAPKDGTVVGTFGPTQVIRQVIGVPGIAFESDKFNWIVAAHAGDAIACVARAAAGVKTLDDAIKREQPLIVAATAPGASTTIWPTVYKEILGVNFKIVSGYKGTSGIRAAMEQGEVDAGCWQWSSVKVTAEPMLADGRAVVFTQLGTKKVTELAQLENAFGRVTSKIDKAVVSALLTENSLGRPYVAPPGVPSERVQLLRRAFTQVLQDAKFLDEANRLNLEIDPLPGEEVEKVVKELSNLPREARERVKQFME
jgi:tripartite-type tricarboxylate transporter receptor subunit TctC